MAMLLAGSLKVRGRVAMAPENRCFV
jgi:hypothetical protein